SSSADLSLLSVHHSPRPSPYTLSLHDALPIFGSTLPRSVISPVIATSLCTGRPVTADASAVASVMPADGPSLGTAPAGMWMCTSYFWYHSSSMPRRRARDLI